MTPSFPVSRRPGNRPPGLPGHRALPLGIPGVTATVSEEALIVHSATPMAVLSSAVVGGGLASACWIVNRKVPHGYRADPEADLRAFVRQRGIPEPFVGLMTAVPLERARAATARKDGLAVAAVVTAGTGNAAAPGLSPPGPRSAGTINIVLVSDAAPSPAAMVNLVTLAAEVKAEVLLEHGARTREGHRATGTSTDAVALACTGRGEQLQYGGPATAIGWLAGCCLREALRAALHAAPEMAEREATP